jgi:uncharacterized OB-fold protein
MCPECGGLTWVARAVAGTGVVHSFTITHHPPLAGFETPFVVALVELDGGTRLVTNLVDIDPPDVRVGLPVEVTFVAVDDELILPLFRPVRERSGA